MRTKIATTVDAWLAEPANWVLTCAVWVTVVFGGTLLALPYLVG